MIFIAHSRHDQAVTANVESAFRDRGKSTWVDFSRIPIGERFVEEISGALGQSSVFLLVSSAASVRSYWVSREVACATRLRASGIIEDLVRLDLDGASIPGDPFDYAFGRIEDVVNHVLSRVQRAARTEGKGDLHRADVTYYHPPPAPRVWLGFSAELTAMDRWFFETRRGIWISGLGGAGKSSLVSVWIAALRLLGYRQPLNVSIRQWSFYEAPDAAAALNQIGPWIGAEREARQLLFLDGMDELATPPVREVCELGMMYPRLAIIVTSRQSRPDEYSALFQTLSLQSLDRAESELLAARLGVGRKSIDRLFDLLQGHPLAISVAASLIERGDDVEDIARALESRG